MSMELTAKLIKLLPEQSGEGKNGRWVKQDFIVETMEQYSKKVCISVWGDKTDLIKTQNPGDVLKISINIESREYNEKWYTDIKAWKIEKDAPSAGQDSPPISENDIPPPPENEDVLPF